MIAKKKSTHKPNQSKKKIFRLIEKYTYFSCRFDGRVFPIKEFLDDLKEIPLHEMDRENIENYIEKNKRYDMGNFDYVIYSKWMRSKLLQMCFLVLETESDNASPESYKGFIDKLSEIREMIGKSLDEKAVEFIDEAIENYKNVSS